MTRSRSRSRAATSSRPAHPRPADITYNGGLPTTGPGDKLIITGGNQGIVTYNYTNAHDGNIVMSNFGTVTYTGLEPITNSGTATDLIFNLPAGANAVTLADDGTGANGMSRLSGPTFETTDFSNPTNSVQINRGNAADTLVVNALPDLTATMFLGDPANPFATVSFGGAITLAANHDLMAYSSGSMSLTGAGVLATSGAGQISLTTASGLTLPAGSSLTTVNGALTLNANQQASPTAGSFVGITLAGATVHATGTGVVTVNGRGATAAGIAMSGSSLISGGTTSGATTTSVTGTGGPGGTNNHGIQAGDTATITSLGGDVSVTGNAGPGANTNHGIILFPGSSGGKITSGGSGNVTVNGTGGANGSDNEGILIDGSLARISAAGTGTVNVTGTAGAGTSKGVLLSRAGSIQSSGGAITVTGTHGATGDFGISITGANSTANITSGSNATVTLIADRINIDPASTLVSAGTGTVNIRQKTNGVVIDLGGTDAANLLGLTDAELDRVFGSTLNIGDANTGNVNVSTLITQTGKITNIFTGTLTNVLSTGALGITGTINSPLTVNGELRPGTSPGIINNIGNVSFASGSVFAVEIGGTTPGSASNQHDQLNVTGTVSLGNATLTTASFNSFVPVAGQTFTIINNDGADAITGTFNGLPEGGFISNFLGSGLTAKISYAGGINSNDVVLTVLANPDISVAVSPASVLEDGAPNLVYTFTRSVTTGALTVNFSVGGTAVFATDYTQTGAASFTATTGTVTFGAGNSTATVTLDPTTDSTVETDETAILTVTSGTGYNVGSPSAATGTITNDDTDVSVAVSPSSVTEDGATNLVYTFTRNGVTTGALTVNFSVGGTAQFGTDYSQSGAATFTTTSGTVTFGAGNSTATVTLDPTADSTVEPDETAILTVTSGTGYNVGSPSCGYRHDHQRRHGCLRGGLARVRAGRWRTKSGLHLHPKRCDHRRFDGELLRGRHRDLRQRLRPERRGFVHDHQRHRHLYRNQHDRRGHARPNDR